MSLAFFATQGTKVVLITLAADFGLFLMMLLMVPGVSLGIIRTLGLGANNHQVLALDSAGASALRSIGIPVYPQSPESVSWRTDPLTVELRIGDTTLLRARTAYSTQDALVEIPTKSILAITLLERPPARLSLVTIPPASVEDAVTMADLENKFGTADPTMFGSHSEGGFLICFCADPNNPIEADTRLGALARLVAGDGVTVVFQPVSPKIAYVKGSQFTRLVAKGLKLKPRVVVFVRMRSAADQYDIRFHAQGPLSADVTSVAEYATRAIGMSVLEQESFLTPISKSISDSLDLDKKVTAAECDINPTWLDVNSGRLARTAAFLRTLAEGLGPNRSGN